MKTLTFLFTLLFISLQASAQVYSYVDANGNTIYTDSPPKGQSTRFVDIPTTSAAPIKESTANTQATNPAENTITDNTAEPVRTIKLSPQGQTSVSVIDDTSTNPEKTDLSAIKKAINISYSSLEIVTPTPDATIINAGGQMMIQVKSQPALISGHKYRFLVDNKVVGELASPALSLNDLVRGEHKLKVQIVDKAGTILTESKEQTFFIRQTTLADKRRVKPCEYVDYGVRPECPLKDKPPPESLLRRATKTVQETIKNVVNTAAETAVDGAIKSTLP